MTVIGERELRDLFLSHGHDRETKYKQVHLGIEASKPSTLLKR